MKWAILLFIAGLVLATAVAVISSNPRFVTEKSGKQTVATTIKPLEMIAKEIAGEDFDVVNILPAGASPHTFEPTPEVLIRLKDAEAIFMIGHGLDDWAADLAKNAPGIQLVTVDKGIKLKNTPRVATFGSGAEAPDDLPVDPHYWLTPLNGKFIAADIAAELKRLNPARTAAIDQRLKDFSSRMVDLDTQIKQLFKDKVNNAILTHHNAWQYFASAYGLVIVATIEPSPGQELTANEMMGLQDIIKKERIKTLFIEPELSKETVSSLAKDLSLMVQTIDPEGSSGASNYAEMLVNNALTIAESL